jgi:hypothetical protein
MGLIRLVTLLNWTPISGVVSYMARLVVENGRQKEMWYSEIGLCALIKVETPIHDNIRKLVTWECKEH